MADFVCLLCKWSCFEDLFHRDLTENTSKLKSVQYWLWKGRRLCTVPSSLAGWVPAATESGFGGQLRAAMSPTQLDALRWGAAKATLLPFTADFLTVKFVV